MEDMNNVTIETIASNETDYSEMSQEDLLKQVKSLQDQLEGSGKVMEAMQDRYEDALKQADETIKLYATRAQRLAQYTENKSAATRKVLEGLTELTALDTFEIK